MILRDHGGPDRSERDDRLVQELRRALGDVRASRADLPDLELASARRVPHAHDPSGRLDPVSGVERREELHRLVRTEQAFVAVVAHRELGEDRKSTRLNSSHVSISYAVFCLKKKKKKKHQK